MVSQAFGFRNAYTLPVILLVEMIWIGLSLNPWGDVWADSSPVQAGAKNQGDIAGGRAIFNGKGICVSCHGRDGDLHRRPQLTPDTAEIMGRLDPKPSDLRE